MHIVFLSGLKQFLPEAAINAVWVRWSQVPWTKNQSGTITRPADNTHNHSGDRTPCEQSVNGIIFTEQMLILIHQDLCGPGKIRSHRSACPKPGCHLLHFCRPSGCYPCSQCHLAAAEFRRSELRGTGRRGTAYCRHARQKAPGNDPDCWMNWRICSEPDISQN